MSKNKFLEKIEVKTPCSENWDQMRGSDEMRFCSHCSKSVNNLSAMTRKKALKLVRESNGNICVRFIKNPANNAPVFAKDFYQIARRAPRLAVGVMTAALSFSSITYAQSEAKSSEITGDIISVHKISSDKNKTAGASSNVSGTIKDQQGAVISGAKITLISETNGESRTITNEDGFYEFNNVATGNYKLEAESSGFANLIIENLRVGENKSSKQDGTMEVGSEIVTVGGMGFVEYLTPLFTAVSEDNLEEVRTLIMRNENINVKDENYDHITPLFLAVENGNAKIAETLLNFGAKINARDDNRQTPLMRLDEDATPELVRLLIKHGAKINLADKEGNTALMLASRSAKAKVLQILISENADLDAQNKDGQTALMNAAEEDNLEAVKALLSAGANVNLKNKEGDTAWDLTGEEKIEKLLESYGATTKVDDSELPDFN